MTLRQQRVLDVLRRAMGPLQVAQIQAELPRSAVPWWTPNPAPALRALERKGLARRIDAEDGPRWEAAGEQG